MQLESNIWPYLKVYHKLVRSRSQMLHINAQGSRSQMLHINAHSYKEGILTYMCMAATIW